MECQSDRLNSYRVEVSGWDASDNFFVEKTLFSWVGAEKEISIRRAPRKDSVVFVRLLQPFACGNFPIPYRVNRIGPRDADGKSKVYLARLRPRSPRNEEIELGTDTIHTI